MPQNRDPEPPKRNEFRRMLGVSVCLHVLVLLVLMVSPAPSAIAPPQAITVDLVAFAPPATSVRVPEPARAPAEVEPIPAEPEPEAPRPKPAEVVLPERPKEPKPKPKPKPKAEKPKPQPKPRREVVLKPKPKAEQSLADLLAEMREETGEPTPEPIVEAAVAPEAPRGGGVRVSPEEAAWKARVKAHIRRSWVVPLDFRDRALETHVMLTIGPSGGLAAPPKITRGSGNLAYDDGILDGIRRANPLPAPPEPGRWPFVFTSEDY